MKNLFTFLFVLSAVVVFSQNDVKYMLSGAITPTSASLRAKLTDTSSNVRAVVSTTNPLTAPFVYSNVSAATIDNNLVAPFSVTGLQPGTKYYYAIESKGVIDNKPENIGTFTTTQAGPQSFTFVAGACNNRPDSKVFEDFYQYNPLFYMMLGDMHYGDPCDQNIADHRNENENRIFNRITQRNLLRDMPLAYVWDDHDYCGNDDVGDQLPGTKNARRVYQEIFPHYPLIADSFNVPIYQSFEIGRVKFILSDLRSTVIPRPGLVNQFDMMGPEQRQWFEQQVLDARDRNMMIAWASSYSWYGFLTDNWGGDSIGRREISEFFRDNQIANLFIMSGDAHMFALDNGVNGDFTRNKNLPYRYPNLQAGPLDNSCSYKGGNYSEGQFYQWFQRRQQYAVVNVDDNGGDSICVTIDGYRIDNNTTSKLVSYTFCRQLGAVQVGIADVQDVQFELFPNPSNGVFNLRISNPENALLEVFTTDGKLVKRMNIADTAYHPVDLSEQAGGVYIARLKTSRGTATKRLVLNK